MAITFPWVINILIVVIARNSVAGTLLYQQDPEMAGFTCSAASLALDLSVSSIVCARQCSKVATCRGFYSTTDGTCVGTPDIITSSSGCSSKPGTLYFKNIDYTPIPAGYGGKCSADVDCSRTYSMCLRGWCSCQAGYRHESATDSCTADCSTYGSTYIRYLYMELDVAYTNHRVNLADCLNLCTASPTCRGFTFCCTDKCRLKDRTPLTDPDLFYSYTNLDLDYYSRNCV